MAQFMRTHGLHTRLGSPPRLVAVQGTPAADLRSFGAEEQRWVADGKWQPTGRQVTITHSRFVGRDAAALKASITKGGRIRYVAL